MPSWLVFMLGYMVGVGFAVTLLILLSISKK